MPPLSSMFEPISRAHFPELVPTFELYFNTSTITTYRRNMVFYNCLEVLQHAYNTSLGDGPIHSKRKERLPRFLNLSPRFRAKGLLRLLSDTLSRILNSTDAFLYSTDTQLAQSQLFVSSAHSRSPGRPSSLTENVWIRWSLPQN